MSAYRAHLDHTSATIETRARYYRNLVIIVAILAVTFAIASLITRNVGILVLLLLLIPICIAYFFIDSILVNQWRNRLLEAWSKQDVDFSPFKQALFANPALPKGTLEGMLATLPKIEDWPTEQKLSTSERERIARDVQALSRVRFETLLSLAIIWTIATVALSVSVLFWDWRPLTAIGAVPIVWGAMRLRIRGK